jgi:hypothetical protein
VAGDARNAVAMAKLDDVIARLRACGTVPEEAAAAAAEVTHAELTRQIAAAETPAGSSWPERKDGGKALATAGKALVVRSAGTAVYARLFGHVARHHKGTAKGGVRRQILPHEITPRLRTAIGERLRALLAARLGGR